MQALEVSDEDDSGVIHGGIKYCDSSGGPTQEEPVFQMLPRSQRHQHSLRPEEARLLWRRAEELAKLRQLVRVRVGRAGPSPALLSSCGELLEQHEIIRVEVPADCQAELGLVEMMLHATQDCATVKMKGRTMTLYRDASLPRPGRSRVPGPDADLVEQRAAAAAAAQQQQQRVERSGLEQGALEADVDNSEEAASGVQAGAGRAGPMPGPAPVKRGILGHLRSSRRKAQRAGASWGRRMALGV